MDTIEYSEHIETGIQNWSFISNWLKESILNEGYSVGVLSFVFMSDLELLDYNKKFLDHDYFTDVITFDNSDFEVVGGDILISVDRVKDNANSLKINYKEELLRVLIHGILHLCGYKDKVELDVMKMREKESEYLKKVNFEI